MLRRAPGRGPVLPNVRQETSDPGKEKSGRTRPNGSGSVYKRGKTWECAVTLGYIIQEDGKRKTIRPTKGGFKTKKEAMEYLPKLREERPRSVPTLNELWTRYKESQKYEKLSASRKKKYTIAWKKLKRLWFVRIDLLTTFDLQDTVDSNAATYYPARDMKGLLSKLYQMALPDQYVKSNLAEFIELPTVNAKEQQAFEAGELTKLWEDYAAGNWWTGYILLMCFTGMMPGELLGCRKEYIDWEGKQIRGAGKKTDVRRSTPIALADVILPVLSDLCEHTAGEKLIKINKDNFYEVYYNTLERAGCRKLPLMPAGIQQLPRWPWQRFIPASSKRLCVMLSFPLRKNISISIWSPCWRPSISYPKSAWMKITISKRPAFNCMKAGHTHTYFVATASAIENGS